MSAAGSRGWFCVDAAANSTLAPAVRAPLPGREGEPVARRDRRQRERVALPPKCDSQAVRQEEPAPPADGPPSEQRQPAPVESLAEIEALQRFGG